MARKPYVIKTARTKDGPKQYCYHYPSLTPIPMPGLPGHEEALRAAQRASVTHVQKKTMGGLIKAFCLTVQHAKRRHATKKVYERTFAQLKVYEDRAVESITRADIEVIYKQIAYSPAWANQFISNCNSLFDFALTEGIVKDWQRPNLKGWKLETGEYATWEPEDIETFLLSNPPEMVRMTFLLGFYTGQRISDVLTMEWSHVKRGVISVCQIKTGARVWVPCHPDLERELAAWRKKFACAQFVVPWQGGDLYGKYHAFTHLFWKAKKAVGLMGRDYPFHGLRKTAACMLYEAGCDISEIQSVTGHNSLAMVEKYIREAKALALASSAMRKVLAQKENRFSGVHRIVRGEDNAENAMQTAA